MSKVTIEIAEAEVESWLDKKKILPGLRDARREHINQLVECIQEGVLELNTETYEFTHNLLEPFGAGEKMTKTLVYKPRLNDKNLQPWMKGVRGDDAEGRMLGYVAALTSTNRQLLELMDTADKRISMAIAIFFL